MTMVVQDPDGNDITVFTADEIAAKDSVITEKETALADAQTKITEHEKWRAEQTENFKKLRDMSDQEKSQLSAAEIESRTRAEKLEADYEALKASIDADKKAVFESKKESALKKWAGDDKDLRAKIEENMTKVTIADPDELVAAAAAISGIAVGGARPNPLHMPIDGDAPRAKEANEKKEFLESPKADAAFGAMNFKPAEKK